MANKIITIGPRTLARMREILRGQRGKSAFPRPRAESGEIGTTDRFWVEIVAEGTGAEEGRYSWKKMVPNEGALIDWPADTEVGSEGAFTATDPNGVHGIPPGTFREVQFVGYIEDDAPVYFFCEGARGMFPVDVVADGGDGNDTPFTYTVTASGVELGTLMSPAFVDEPDVQVSEADLGTGYFGDAGFVLWHVNEVELVNECDDEIDGGTP